MYGQISFVGMQFFMILPYIPTAQNKELDMG